MQATQSLQAYHALGPDFAKLATHYQEVTSRIEETREFIKHVES
jgi:hypothetical protein